MNMYQDELLDHYWHPHNRGVMDAPTFTATERNPLCGDVCTVSARVTKNSINEARFSGEGCAISQAAASLFTDTLRGKTLAEADILNEQDMYALIPVPISPARAACALLAFNAFKKGLQKYAHI